MTTTRLLYVLLLLSAMRGIANEEALSHKTVSYDRNFLLKVVALLDKHRCGGREELVKGPIAPTIQSGEVRVVWQGNSQGLSLSFFNSEEERRRWTVENQGFIDQCTETGKELQLANDTLQSYERELSEKSSRIKQLERRERMMVGAISGVTAIVSTVVFFWSQI